MNFAVTTSETLTEEEYAYIVSVGEKVKKFAGFATFQRFYGHLRSEMQVKDVKTIPRDQYHIAREKANHFLRDSIYNRLYKNRMEYDGN